MALATADTRRRAIHSHRCKPSIYPDRNQANPSGARRFCNPILYFLRSSTSQPCGIFLINRARQGTPPPDKEFSLASRGHGHLLQALVRQEIAGVFVSLI